MPILPDNPLDDAVGTPVADDAAGTLACGQPGRIAERRHLSVRGVFRVADGCELPIRTVDATAFGLGVVHADALPPGGRGLVALRVPNRHLTDIIVAHVEVRHSTLSRGEWRSGLRITRISERSRALLERELSGRMKRVD